MDATGVTAAVAVLAVLLALFVGSVAMLQGKPWTLSRAGQVGFLIALVLVYGAIFASMTTSHIRLARSLMAAFPSALPVSVRLTSEMQFLGTGLLAVALAVLSTDPARRRVKWPHVAGSAVILCAWIAVLLTNKESRIDGVGNALLTLPFAVLLAGLVGGVIDSRTARTKTLICPSCHGKTPAHLSECQLCQAPLAKSQAVSDGTDFSQEWPDVLASIRDNDPDASRREAAKRELQNRGLE